VAVADSAAATCAHLKRYLELLEGDPDVRARVLDARVPREHILADAGLALPVDDMGPFWRMPLVHGFSDDERAGWMRELERSRLRNVWVEWRQAEGRRHAEMSHSAVPKDARVRAWRARQLSRARSEQIAADDLSHFPLLAFELTHGCSVQCWFCALDPEKLTSHFAYTAEHGALWRDVLGHCWDLFGDGCQSAICYHGTDPFDNPDFFRFQDDVIEIFGVLPQVTTAQALKNPDWTRRLLELQKQHPSHHRFSVLTLGMLRKIHQAFTAEEIADVSLVLQHKEALGLKVASGRANARPDRMEAEEQYRATSPHAGPKLDMQTSCECTAGFLVNMATGRIQMISPADPSPATPLGYATHAEGTFRTADEFRAFLDRTVAAHMRERLEPGDVVRLRAEVTFEPLADGFAVTSRYRRQALRGAPHFARLGDLVREGTHTTSAIVGALLDMGVMPFEATGWLDRVFQAGMLAEPV
jgi:radical SAM family RiPP maturation amino acid epimerase